MLKIAASDEVYDVPVSVTLPDGESHEYTARFRYPGQADLTEMLEAQTADAAMLESRLVGWKGIADAEGEALAFGADSLKTLIDIPYFVSATARAYVAWALGLPAKNLPASPEI